MSEVTAGTIASLCGVSIFGILLFVASASTKEGLYNQVKKGEVQFWDEVYTCEYKGKYVDEKRFIPATIETLPAELEVLRMKQ